MREETVTATQYSPTLGREVVVRLTYSVSEGPRPDIVRWFLIRKEVLEVEDDQTSNCRDDARQNLNREPGTTSTLQLEESMEAHPQGTAQG